jgi:hypothetical protein
MKHLTIRNVPEELGDRLLEEKRVRGRSLNQTVLELLSQAVGLSGQRQRSNGLGTLAGTWTAEDQAEFEDAIEGMEEIDEELWR